MFQLSCRSKMKQWQLLWISDITHVAIVTATGFQHITANKRVPVAWQRPRSGGGRGRQPKCTLTGLRVLCPGIPAPILPSQCWTRCGKFQLTSFWFGNNGLRITRKQKFAGLARGFRSSPRTDSELSAGHALGQHPVMQQSFHFDYMFYKSEKRKLHLRRSEGNRARIHAKCVQFLPVFLHSRKKRHFCLAVHTVSIPRSNWALAVTR